MLRRQKKFCLCLCTFNVTFGYMTTANMIKGQMNFHWENEKKHLLLLRSRVGYLLLM